MQVAAEAIHQDISAEESADTATSTGSPRRISNQSRQTLQQAIQGTLQPTGAPQVQPDQSDLQAAAEPEGRIIDIDPLGNTGGFILPEEDFASDDDVSTDSSRVAVTLISLLTCINQSMGYEGLLTLRALSKGSHLEVIQRTKLYLGSSHNYLLYLNR